MKEFLIDPSNVDPDPFKQFDLWYHDYLKTQPIEPTAMFLATAGHDRMPLGRVVLLKAVDKSGFVFYTNYSSRKGRDIEDNPKATLTFYWPESRRQVRVAGEIEMVSAKESDEYFRSRPRESQISAWASNQGAVLKNREELLQLFEKIQERYSGQEVPRPDYWGGYRLIPDRFEFWQGRENRIHDRVEYFKEGFTWNRLRLAP